MIQMGLNAATRILFYQTTSHVTGSVSQHRWTCETYRMHGMKCGPDGDLWEPKDGAVGFV